MSDTIIRLKVESQEYENRLKRAVQGMQQLEMHVREMGAGFEDAEKADIEFVRALGQMETKATSNTGKLAELKSAFVELSVQYNNLSDAEKNSEFGVALNQSLGQLKGRIDDLGGQIQEANTDINGMGGILDSVAGKIGIPTELFTKMGLAVAAAGTAIKVATDALKKNEEFMDEWGRITESATAIYDGFLNALNTGDFSTFFSNMDGIVQSAREAYDALDDLGTFQAFNQINELKARAGLDNAIAAYREGTGSKEAIRSASANMIAQLEQRLDYQSTAYRKNIEKLANTRDVDIELLTKALSGEYGDYKALKELKPSKIETYTYQEYEYNPLDPSGIGGSYVTKTGTRMVAANEQEELAAMLRKLTDDELNALQKLGADAANTEVQIAGVNKQLSRLLKATDVETVNAEEVLPAVSIDELNKAYDQVVPLSVELLDTSKVKLKEDMEELRKRLVLEPIKLGVQVGTDGKGTVETAKQTEKAWGAAANAISAIGGALQQIEDPSAKVAGIIMQAVANIALGFAQAAASPATGAAGVFGWIAAATAGLATMTATIASIKSVTSGSYADGGIIPGNNYSGDMLTANVNAGELILNRAQQSSIASQLASSNPMSGMQLEALISGESLRLVLANNASRRGGNRSQYAISKFG